MSQTYRKIIADKVKGLRLQAGLNREELSLKLGFDNSYISKLENYRVNITIDKIEKIGEFFNVEPTYFFKLD